MAFESPFSATFLPALLVQLDKKLPVLFKLLRVGFGVLSLASGTF